MHLLYISHAMYNIFSYTLSVFLFLVTRLAHLFVEMYRLISSFFFYFEIKMEIFVLFQDEDRKKVVIFITLSKIDTFLLTYRDNISRTMSTFSWQIAFQRLRNISIFYSIHFIRADIFVDLCSRKAVFSEHNVSRAGCVWLVK